MVSHSKTGLLEVSPGIWAAIMSIIPPEGGGPNAGFVLAGDQVIVIDSMINPGTARQLADHLHQVTDKPPTYLINTHHHGDHVFGNAVFSPPATIIAHENVREVLLAQGDEMLNSFTQRFSDVLPDIKDTVILTPQITYRDRMTFHLNGRTLELIHPGVSHTHGDTMVYLPNEKVLFAGDMLFNHIFPPIFGSASGWIAAIEQVEAMDVETIVPGHGFLATKKDFGDLKQLLIELRIQVKECFNRGLSPEEATQEIDFAYLKWPRTERLGPNVEVIYRELSEERPGTPASPE
jgi:cyclase